MAYSCNCEFFNPWLSRDLDKVYFFEAGTCPGDGSRVFGQVSTNSNHGLLPAFRNGLYLQCDKRQRPSV